MEFDKKFKQLFFIACARGSVTDVRSWAKSLQVDLAKRFLEKGVSPSATDKEGRTGAHLAASRGDLATLRLLFSAGASLVAADNTGRTPLHNAAMRDRTSAITYLVHKGAWVDVCDSTGCTPLHLAARSGAAGSTSRLLDLGASPAACSRWQLTALGEAVTRGHVKVCKALATEGAASPEVLSQRVNGGFTLVHLAAGAGAASTVAWLLERTNSESVNDVENEEGLSPLHCCVLGGNLNFATIDKLASCGADASTTDASGKTPLDILERPHESPDTAGHLALLPVGLVDDVKKRLSRRSSSESRRTAAHPSALRTGAKQCSDLTSIIQQQLVDP